MRLPDRTDLAPYYRHLRFRLDCGREVVEGFYVSPSTIGYLEGGKKYIRDPIIQRHSRGMYRAGSRSVGRSKVVHM